jgi:branched-chain amino acid aminotransferase
MSDPFSQGCAWLDDAYVPIAQARIPITDMGFTRSDCTYDVVAAWQGKFFRLAEHLARFERSCLRLRLTPPVAFAEMPSILGECVRRAGLQDAYVEMICTRGVPRAGERDPRLAANRFYAFAIPYVWVATPAQQETGIALVIAENVERVGTRAIDPTVKNFQWGDFVRAQFEAYERDAHTAVLVDAAGYLTEGPGFNLFAYAKGILLTPGEGVLHGITRQTVLELALREGIPTRSTRLDAATVRDADEVFLTSTAGGIMAVTTVDGRAIGDGTPGAVTRRLHTRYWAEHERGPWVTPIYSPDLAFAARDAD